MTWPDWLAVMFVAAIIFSTTLSSALQRSLVERNEALDLARALGAENDRLRALVKAYQEAGVLFLTAEDRAESELMTPERLRALAERFSPDA